MKRVNSLNSSVNVTLTPPKKLPKQSILSRFANSAQVSPSTAKNSQAVNVNVVKEDGVIVGVAIDGAFEAGPFLAAPNARQEFMDLEAPFEEIGTVKSLPVKGKLFKATSPETRDLICKDGKPVSADTFYKLCPYVVSQVGESPGSCKVWLFTALQLIELQKTNKSEEVAGSFEDVVYSRIHLFFEKTKRPVMVKDVNTLKPTRFQPSTLDEAMESFHSRQSWVVKTRVFELDTEEKVDSFAMLAYTI